MRKREAEFWNSKLKDQDLPKSLCSLYITPVYFVLSALILSFFFPLDSAATQFTVNSIEIRGSKTMQADTILGILQTKVGEEVSVKLIRDDVKELFKLGQFSDIKVDSSGSKEGIHLTFILEEWPKVKEVVINGNNEISDSKIKDVLTIAPGRSLSGRLLHENKKKIISMYQKKGYYLVDVEDEIIPDPEGTSTVSFSIVEGEKMEVQEINIVGNKRMSDREIKKQMKVKKGKRFDDSYLEGDKRTIEVYYHQNGFINAKVTKVSKEISEDKTGIIINVELEEGPQFRVGSINVEIQPGDGDEKLFSEKDIIKEFGLEEGDIFSEIEFSNGLAKINKMYLDK
jgi:outer membrane protein insertion porin family